MSDLPPIPSAEPLPPRPWNILNAFTSVYWYRAAQLSGRASRSEYWLSWVWQLIITAGLTGLLALCVFSSGVDPESFTLAEAATASSTPLLLLIGLGGLLFTWLYYCHLTEITLLCRRLHDVGMSEWWMVLLLCGSPLLGLGGVAYAVPRVVPCFDIDYAEMAEKVGQFCLCLGATITLLRFIIAVSPSTDVPRYGEQALPPVTMGPATWSPLLALRRLWRGHYADFNGRACRQETWLYFLSYYPLMGLCLFAVCAIGQMIISACGVEAVAGLIAALAVFCGILLVLYLLLIIPVLALYARRCHDIGISALWLIPLFCMSSLSQCFVQSENIMTVIIGAYALSALQSIGIFLLFILPSAKPNKWGERAQLPNE